MKKILQISSLPNNLPHVGGYIRQYKIREQLKQGFMVKCCSFSFTNMDDYYTDFDFFINKVDFNRRNTNNIEHSLYLCQYLLNKKRILIKYINSTIKKYDPNIIILETPYLYDFFAFLKLTNSISNKCELVYSSHNLEQHLQSNLPKEQLEEIIRLENLCVKNSLFQICCSVEEQEIMPNAYLLPNGTDKIVSSFEHLKNSEMVNIVSGNYVTVSSYHLPNILGIKRVLNYLPESTKLVLIGECCNYDYQSNNIIKLGVLNNEDMQYVVDISNGILLPIYEGSGTNLKTAQAIVSNKAIVATEFSFRGFEEYMNDDGVFIYKNDIQLENILRTPKEEHYFRDVKGLFWDEILTNLVDIFQTQIKK